MTVSTPDTTIQESRCRNPQVNLQSPTAGVKESGPARLLTRNPILLWMVRAHSIVVSDRTLREASPMDRHATIRCRINLTRGHEDVGTITISR